ncbi:related to cytochrome P450 CYP3/CYP5/CYP6/CYP9 subfamilies [Phialocephala subalpina]|uniref:Related to cytochrome P450 CYP3/CYP5/CYP6/CYP9 subfamilies n=1 Tax=Phialocephala subalpina TaxID=576137 RepID=A0A1L7XYV8_9HELO|nr:related to cytochrome P450 CYP3/CYP5/CYP6/CYP9 subfamilies [Phialocephala subalpina]
MDFTLFERPSVAILAATILIWFSYLVGLALYRLYFSPLAKFPGPKLAALSQWYEFYYDVYLGGKFVFQIQKLHKQYGPIVRITPFELHIEDSDYYEELYSRSARYDRYEWMSGRFGANNMTFTTAKSDLHAIRRAPLNPMFSKRSIAKFEPVIRDKIELLCKGLEEARDTGSVVDLINAFSAFTSEIITEYCFGFGYGHLESKGFKENFHEPFKVIRSIPDWITVKMAPELRLVLDLKVKITNAINGEDKAQIKSSYPTIFHELLESNLPPQEKSVQRLADEAQLMIGAGLLTTSWILTVIFFHILSNPRVLNLLRAELKENFPDPNAKLVSIDLERLPYLSACIQEGQRLSDAVSGRSPRLSPEKATRYKDWTIPVNTPVSMTIIDIHHDPQIYQNSREFIPERWLDNPKTGSGDSLSRLNTRNNGKQNMTGNNANVLSCGSESSVAAPESPQIRGTLNPDPAAKEQLELRHHSILAFGSARKEK